MSAVFAITLNSWIQHAKFEVVQYNLLFNPSLHACINAVELFEEMPAQNWRLAAL
jgi:hypothetical protein